MPLDHREPARYDRQLVMPGWGEEGQARLGSSAVFVAGLGGLGCPASVYLAAAGVGRLVVCDADAVERSNLNRQSLYTDTDLGHAKAGIAAGRLHAVNPTIEVVPISLEIDRENAGELITGADVVVDCLDNVETRVALSRAAMRAEIPLVHAAVSELTGYLSVFDPPRTPCFECFLSHKPASVEPAIPGCTAGVMGSLQAMEVLKLILGIGHPLAGRLLIVEGVAPSFEVVELTRDPNCRVCSG